MGEGRGSARSPNVNGMEDRAPALKELSERLRELGEFL